VVSNDEKILVDERENNLIFMGSKGNFEKVKALATLFDSTPKQIQIEALIVETSHAFMRQLGISMAGFGDTIQTPGPNQPNGTFKTVLDNLNSKSLEVKLTAAESNGNAKVVSRPKVITLNNKTAKVRSGITYHVKTLSNVQTGDTNQSSASGQASTTPGIVTGGVASVEAGLSLNILPTMVGTDDIKLTVDINNSTSDIGSSVDGIPGIIKNSANTTVIVRNKQTAVIAGLIKQQTSKNSGGVPFLSDIPLLGLLFKSHASTDENNELVIFLTPTIGSPETGNPDAYVDEGRFRSHSGPATAPEAPVGN
jgi:type IV pilus assembly protein PilQ